MERGAQVELFQQSTGADPGIFKFKAFLGSG